MPSNPTTTGGPLRKELTQCQNCFKSRLREGITLSTCAGCKTALYCSKECQKAHWRLHKEQCMLNRRLLVDNAGVDPVKGLRAFTSKHRPSIAEYGLCAFDLKNYPKSYLDEVLVIFVKARPGENHPSELSFLALDAGMCPVNAFEDFQVAELRQQMKNRNEESIRYGSLGSIWVVLFDREAGLRNFAPVGFGKDALDVHDPEWKRKLLHNLNNGVIV